MRIGSVRDVRQTAVRGDVLQQGEANFLEGHGAMLEALSLKILLQRTVSTKV